MELPAFHGQPDLAGTLVPLPRNCEPDSVSTGGGRTFVTGDCGGHRLLHDTAKLIELSLHGRPRVWRIGRCPDGTDVSVTRSGQVLLSAYLFCNPPLAGHRPRTERSVLDRLSSHGLHQIAVVPNWGNLVWDGLVW